MQVDLDPAEIGRNYPVAIGAVADVGLALAAIEAALQRRGGSSVDRPPSCGTTSPRPAPRCSPTPTNAARATSSRSEPERILRDVREAMPEDTVLVTDVGWNKNGVAQRYPMQDTGRFITPGGASTMGFGPAAALGVQMAWPDRPVVALIGDGGMSAQLAALPTAVERDLPVVFVVMNNAAHGTIADLQASSYGASYGCEFLDRTARPTARTSLPSGAPAARTDTASSRSTTWPRRSCRPWSRAGRR